MTTVYCVSSWRNVFEKSDARKVTGNLKWISCPVSFNSTGYQSLLESFDGMTAAALYGGWLALCQLAAQSPIRGQLSGQKGEPYTPGRIARLSGLPAELFEQLMPWAVSVGWLVPLEVTTSQPMANSIPDAVSASSGESPENPPMISGERPAVPGRSPDHRTGQDRTGQDKTRQDGTGQNGPSGPGPIFGKDSNAETHSISSVVADLILDNPELQELTRSRVSPDPSGRVEMAASVFDPLKATDVVNRPPMWFAAVWYKRQLAAPDPVLKAGNAAEAAIVVALAMGLKKVPDEQVKAGRKQMFISLLTKGSKGLASRAAPSLPAAIAMVRETLARSAAQQPAETP